MEESKKPFYRNLKGMLNWQIASATACFVVGLSSGMLYTTTTNNHLSQQKISNLEIKVSEKANTILDFKSCTITIPSPSIGELSILYDEKCDKYLDEVSLKGVRYRITPELLSVVKYNQASLLLDQVTYQIK